MDTGWTTEVGHRLRRTRKALGYEEAADFLAQIDYDKGSYSKTEKGERSLSLQLAMQIKDRWGVSLDWLYCGDKAAISDDLYLKIRKAA